jgi:SAM-dependent methyltransferase
MKMSTSNEQIKSSVRQIYADIARRLGGASQPSCCGPAETAAESTGNAGELYAAEEIADLPSSVTSISMGNGNPLAHAELQPGEVVLDLGSGGGIDCFLAARQVGPEGRAIGLDMTPEMIKLARSNAKKVEATNTDFRYGEMEDIPLPDASVDVVVSNCVINLSPDKDAVFAEIYRVLRPGGRISVSDSVVTRGDMPQSVRDDMNKWAGCIAGAIPEHDYVNKLQAVGFGDVEIIHRDDAVEEAACCGGSSPDGDSVASQASCSPTQSAEYTVESVRIEARKPQGL